MEKMKNVTKKTSEAKSGVSKRKPRKKKKLTQADIKKYPMTELDHIILKIKANEAKYTAITVLVFLAIFFIVALIVFSSVQRYTSINNNLLKDGSLLIKFEEKENGLGDIVDLVDVPTYDDNGRVFDTYKVTITNDSKESHVYQVLLDDDTEMIEMDNCSDIFLDKSYLRYSINGGDTMRLNEEDERRIVFGTLSGGEKITYTIKVWVSDTYVGRPHYHGKFVVEQVDNK